MLIESRINFRKKFSSHTIQGHPLPVMKQFTLENIIFLPGVASHEDILSVKFQNTSDALCSIYTGDLYVGNISDFDFWHH